MKFQTRDAAVDACIIEINGLLDKGQMVVALNSPFDIALI
jgi:hypothetical protein